MASVNDFLPMGVSQGYDNKMRSQQVVFDNNGAATVTPNDASDLSTPCNAFYVGGSGNVQITALNGTVVVLNGMIAGTLYRISAKRIWATNTTATNIVAFND